MRDAIPQYVELGELLVSRRQNAATQQHDPGTTRAAARRLGIPAITSILSSARGFAGLEGVQRLYNIDLMALVSYDQVTHTDDNKLSLGYLTIVGAYVLRGSSHDTATLVDLAVVDPATRSLVLRAGGTSVSHDNSTLVDIERDSRRASAAGFTDATDQMLSHFDAALTAFQTDVRNGKANVRVVARSADRRAGTGGTGGGGRIDAFDITALLLLVAVARCVPRSRTLSRL